MSIRYKEPITPLTIAALKRIIKPGVRLTLTFHQHANNWADGVGEMIRNGTFVRVVKTVQSNGFSLSPNPAQVSKSPDSESWMYYPKASRFFSTGPCNFSILDEGGNAFMSYRIEETSCNPEQTVLS